MTATKTLKQHWPSIKAVAQKLRLINANVEGECDVYLQVCEPRIGWPCSWVVRTTLDYDDDAADHRGFWGSSSIPGVVQGVVKRFDSLAVARELLEQAKEQASLGALAR